MAITKGEYFSALQKEERRASSGRVKHKIIAAAVLLLGTAAILGINSMLTISERNKQYNRFVTGEETATFAQLEYRDAFDVWNQNSFGNDVNTLLGGGKVLSRDGYSVLPGEDGYDISYDGVKTGSIDMDISYLNIVDKDLIFRSDEDRRVYVFHMDTGIQEPLLEGNIGELIACNDRLYYIDFDKESRLLSSNLDGLGGTALVDRPIMSFMICGDTAIYLGTDQILYQMDLTQNVETPLLYNIERFFVADKIIVESGKTILEYSTVDGKSASLLESRAVDMQLVGACSRGIFYQSSQNLYCLFGNDPAEQIASGYDLYRSLYSDGATVHFVGKNADGVKYASVPLPASMMEVS